MPTTTDITASDTSFDNNTSTQTAIKDLNESDSSNQIFNLNEAPNVSLDDTAPVLNDLNGNIAKLKDTIGILTDIQTSAPQLISKLQEELKNREKSLNEVQSNLSKSNHIINIVQETVQDAVQNGKSDESKLSQVSSQFKDLVLNFLSIKGKYEENDSYLKKLKEDLKKVQIFTDDFGLKSQAAPEVAQDLSPIVKSIEGSLRRIEENEKVKLFKDISTALTDGKSDSLPKDLLDLIQHLIIDRLENILRSYEEISGKYVAGEITHEQFNNLTSKQAFLMALRERVIEDIIHEYENNNLFSTAVPNRLKIATEKMISKNLNHSIPSFQAINEPQTAHSSPSYEIEDESESVSQSYSVE